MISCTNQKTVDFQTEEFKIRYIYNSQFILDCFTIKRQIVIENKINHSKLKFDLENDLENLDETRFHLIDSIKFNKFFQVNILLIEDPFAQAIVDLKNLDIIYNSHGEDSEYESLEILSEKKCIGKVTNYKFIKDNCIIEFW